MGPISRFPNTAAIVNIVDARWTSCQALPAITAFVCMIIELLLGIYVLRIMAPWAMERAALDEDGSSDAGAVMEAESLNFGDEWSEHGAPP